MDYQDEQGKPLGNPFHEKLFKDSDGDIWATSHENGFYIYNPSTETFRNYRPRLEDSTSMPDIRSKVVFQDSKERHWVAFHKEGFGLFDKEKGHFTKLVKTNGLFGKCRNQSLGQ